MTMDRRSFTTLLVLLAAATSSACRDAPLAVNVNTNTAPVAHAGEMQKLDYDGSPVSVKLDGSGSSDSDGTIVSYRWLSGDAALDGGMGRGGPDPEDERSPTVMLDAGTWRFTLFVIDDKGGVSQPSTVTIEIGNGLPPEVAECSSAALQTISEDCRLCLCGLDEMCRGATTACDESCWGFYGCVQNQCGDVAADMTALADCVRANCSDFFGGIGQYMALDPCLKRDPCGQVCGASVQGM